MSKKQKDDHGLINALAGYDSIRDMVAALQCDYDRLNELCEEAKEFENEHGYKSANAALQELEVNAGECKSREDAERRIHEDALSVEVRSDWREPGSEASDAGFKILLTTGGPALQMRGELNDHGEPSRAWLEYQDWGSPWTMLLHDSADEPVDQDILLAYASCFYFGEG